MRVSHGHNISHEEVIDFQKGLQAHKQKLKNVK